MELSQVLQDIQVGDWIYFKNHKRGFEVKAADDRYFIVVKRCFKTFLYSIFDRREMICGANNLVFNLYDYLKQEEVEQSLKDLYGFENGFSRLEISHRNSCDIIDAIDGYRKKDNKIRVFLNRNKT